MFHAPTFRIFIATSPIDFRKGMDGLAAYVVGNFDLDPFDGAVWVFRSRRADKLKMICWDGTGLVMTVKRLDGKRFIWPKAQDNPVILTKVQFDALFSGVDWHSIGTNVARKPIAA